MQQKALLTGIATLTLVFAGCNATVDGQTQVRTATKNFYTGLRNSSNADLRSRYDSNPSVSKRFRNRLSALSSDNERTSSVFCGNGSPTSFDVSSDVKMTGDNTATVTVMQHFETGDVPVQVSLTRNGSSQSNAWFIDDVNCGNRNVNSSSMNSSENSDDADSSEDSDSSTSSMKSSKDNDSSTMTSSSSSRSRNTTSSSAFNTTSSRSMTSSSSSSESMRSQPASSLSSSSSSRS